MKVLLVGDFGVIHTRRYLDLIRKAGCDVVLLNTSWSTLTDAVPANHYYAWPKTGKRLTRYFAPSMARKLSELLVRLQLRWLRVLTRPDITHVQWIDGKAWLVAEAGFSPLVLTSWGTDLNVTRDRNHDPVELRHKAEVISKASLLIADSQDMIDIANNLAMTRAPSMLLPLGIDTRLFRPVNKAEALERRRKLNIPETAKVVLSPRAFRQNYCHDIILRAFARAVKKRDIQAYLVFKAYDCRDRNDISKIMTIASEYNIQDCIRVIDEMPYHELPIYYAMGDFAVNFPVMDAFPVTLLECLACELPVLSIRLPSYDSYGMPAYLQFTDAPTEDSLYDGIAQLLLTNVQQDMSRARAYVSANFDEAIIARDLVRAYENILKTAN